jgi:3-oxoacyl-[acyl-carrier protein] reductase
VECLLSVTLAVSDPPNTVAHGPRRTRDHGGFSISPALAANRTAVAVVGRDDHALAVVTDDIRARGGRALAARADCTVEAEVNRAARTVMEQLGPVDILVAFAGGNGMPVPTAQEPPPTGET